MRNDAHPRHGVLGLEIGMKMTAEVRELVLINLEVEVARSVQRHLEDRFPHKEDAWYVKKAALCVSKLMELVEKGMKDLERTELEIRTMKERSNLPADVGKITWLERSEATQEFFGKWGVSYELTRALLLVMWHKI